MTARLDDVGRVDAESAESFARRFRAFADELSPREREILAALVDAAVPPLDRFGRRDPSELLTPAEQKLLDELLSASAPNAP